MSFITLHQVQRPSAARDALRAARGLKSIHTYNVCYMARDSVSMHKQSMKNLNPSRARYGVMSSTVSSLIKSFSTFVTTTTCYVNTNAVTVCMYARFHHI